MVKERRFNWNPCFDFKQNHIFLKFAVSFLLVSLAFRLFYSHSSSGVHSVTEIEPPFLEKTVKEKDLLNPAPESVQIQKNPDQISHIGKSLDEESEAPSINALLTQEDSDQIPLKPEKCDIFVGDWISDPSGPIYTNESCNVITDHQNCMKNGRPDSEYLYWRWKPRDCELPRFNPERFLETMRNKSWAFVGDSICRNHAQSLLCILSKVETANDVYHDAAYASIKWHFPSYNFTLSVIWSPFLLKSVTFDDTNGASTGDVQLHLDQLDKKWTNQYQSFDYMVISAGKWFFKPSIYFKNNTIIGCNYCQGKNLTEFGAEYAYRIGLKSVLKFITDSNHSGTVLYRTTTPDHFENGTWDNGGTCKRTVPFKEEEVSLKDYDSSFRNIELEEFEKFVNEGTEKRVNLKLLDTTHLSLLRPDGHPGPFRQFQPFLKDKNAKVQYDCLHWCLPGPIDSWNDLIMEMLMNS